MRRLSSPIGDIKDHYTAVVIGSGYGGGIAASRLARAGQTVCLLERGKEILPGEYPNSMLSATTEFQSDLPAGHVGSRTGLYDLRVNKDINVFAGCGLGGTSLINANVAVRPEPRVFEDRKWPQGLRDDVPTRLDEGYRRAQEMLKPEPYPDDFPPLAKLKVLEQMAGHLGSKFYRPPINVTFEDGVNHVGVEQSACKLCGDCVTGCNYSAKNTVLMNYLPDAKNHGAEIFTQVAVRRIERAGERWLVHYQLLNSGRESFGAPTMFVGADVVVLAAGTLGSNEILLRSGENGLSLSERVGHGFSGNGDALGFAYNADQEVNGIGLGGRSPERADPPGPCIAGIIDMRAQPDLKEGIIIEEGVVPGGIATFLPHVFAAGSKLFGKDTDTGAVDWIKERLRELSAVIGGPRRGALRNTLVFLVNTHDDGEGRFHLEGDRLRLDWPGVGAQPIFEEVDKRLFKATEAVGGTYVKSPTWTRFTNHNIVTVHPLGGCGMGDDAEHGAVNHKGQVFSDTRGTDVHDGLYVADGSVVPRSLGINPLLTISALAERTVALLAADRGWEISYDLPSAPSHQEESRKLGIQFTETMRGSFSTEVRDDFERAESRGKQDGSSFEFTLTVISDDLDEMLDQDEHQGKIVGTVKAPALSSEPLTVTDGVFNLLIDDPDRVDTKLMRYRMKLTSEEGVAYFFHCYKLVHDDPGPDMWSDTTTLYITVSEGESEGGAVVGKGILKIHPNDFRRQMTTLQVNNAANVVQRLAATARFGRYFSKSLYEVYGGVFSRPDEADHDAPPREKRELRMDAPEIYNYETGDGVGLRLTRYIGGRKGPVVLSPGFGTSTLAYTIDTVETNLPEYLYANGYDIWLLDYRASPELPSAESHFSLDDIATQDYPATIAKVREITGAESVQVMAHCVGSMTFLMAMLAGLQGVRSAVSSQLTLFPVSPTLNDIRAGLHLGSFLTVLGMETMSTDFDASNWKERLFDRVTRLYPTRRGEQCGSAVCRRIRFMYGEVFKHDLLNDATHRAIHEMFATANLGSFNHIAEMLRKDQVVDKEGNDVYLPRVERLGIPISFLHGAENGLFLPKRIGDDLRTAAREERRAPLYPTRRPRLLAHGYVHR